MRWMMLGLLGACTVGTGDGVVQDDEVPMAGWTAQIATLAHDTSGTAVLVDDTTLEVRDFTFDGGGIDARLFLVVDGAPFFRDFELTDNLVGTPFEGETLTLQVPEDATPGTWDAISLWCIPAGAAFGTCTFGAPDAG